MPYESMPYESVYSALNDEYTEFLPLSIDLSDAEENEAYFLARGRCPQPDNLPLKDVVLEDISEVVTTGSPPIRYQIVRKEDGTITEVRIGDVNILTRGETATVDDQQSIIISNADEQYTIKLRLDGSKEFRYADYSYYFNPDGTVLGYETHDGARVTAFKRDDFARVIEVAHVSGEQREKLFFRDGQWFLYEGKGDELLPVTEVEFDGFAYQYKLNSTTIRRRPANSPDSVVRIPPE